MKDIVDIANVKVQNTTYEKIIYEIQKSIKHDTKFFIVSINAKKIILANQQPELMDIINSSNCQIADGFGVIVGSKILKQKIKKRIKGIDLFEKICEVSDDINAKIFLFGSTTSVVEDTQRELRNRNPNIEIVGISDGYNTNDASAIKMINKSKANVVFVAKGSPSQEYWINKNKDFIEAPVIMGVGGSFDVVSSRVKRAPKWIQNIGFEWLYRFLKQPRRYKDLVLIYKYVIFVIKYRKNKRKR